MDWPFLGRDDLLHEVTSVLESKGVGAVLQGDLGVGKTRLAQVVAGILADRGWHVERCPGSPSGVDIPFAAVIHLAPQPLSPHPAFNLERVRRAIVQSAGAARLMLLIDDGNLIDAASMALFHSLAIDGDAALLITLRAGEPGNLEIITSLWKEGHARLFDVKPLDRPAHDELVTRVLAPSASPASADRLWQLTQGNPLFLREIIGMADGQDLARFFEREAGGPGEPGRWSRLAAIVAAKARRLTLEEIEALDFVALSEPVSMSVMRLLATAEVLASLEGHGMVVVEDLGGTWHLRTAHPIYGATRRATLPSLRKRLLSVRLANAYLEAGLGAGDSLRAAGWLLDVAEPLPPGLALQASAEALAKGDAEFAERLARLGLEDDSGVASRILLGSALSVQHRPVEAREIFQEALAAAATEIQRVETALAFARHTAWMELDFSGGTALLDQVLPTLSDPGSKLELRAEQAIIAALAGDAVTTQRIAAEILADSAANDRVLLSALIQSTLARCMLGWFDGLGQDLDRGEALAAGVPLASDQIGVTRAMWLRFVDLSAALAVTVSGYERAYQEGGASGIWSLTQAWVLMDTGDLTAALITARRCLSELLRFDPFHNSPMLHALMATIWGLRGETDSAKEALALAGPLIQLEARSRAWADRAMVWMTAEAPDQAAALSIQAGERAAAATMIAWSSPLYHDAVRLGYPELAVEPLERLVANTSAPLIATMSSHASAAAGRGVAQLVAVADDFESRGSPLYAAEALGQAAAFAGGFLSAQLTVRALHLAAQCPGASTPLIRRLISPLSRRESEISSLAAQGLTSRTIAERQFLSVRTVDNHLSTVYRKLGISGREELVAIHTKASSES